MVLLILVVIILLVLFGGGFWASPTYGPVVGFSPVAGVLLLLLLLWAIGVLPVPRVVQAPVPPRYGWTYAGMYALVNRAAAEFGVSAYWMGRVIACESGFNPNATNAWSGAAGIAQFEWPTFNGYVYHLSWARGTWLSPYNPRVATRLMAWMWRRGWANQWTCSFVVGYLTGATQRGKPLYPATCHLPVYRTAPSCWRHLPHHGRMTVPGKGKRA